MRVAALLEPWFAAPEFIRVPKTGHIALHRTGCVIYSRQSYGRTLTVN